jgi:SpoVK/Ycf46/Vps4 family AAA+-type ATPase
VADVARAVRERPAVRLEALARRRRPVARPADLVLSPQATRQLDELVARLRHRDRVFDEWGLVPHGAHRPGVLALFTGPSGTGKTLAAEVIAGRLDLDLYAVDLSQVVSKYIGETEKNLARVFDAVEGSAAVLLFDEADSVFGKRTETRDAHDRYANLEVSYLLARLETFTGLAVLASNLRGNIDTAFLRRMDFIVEFAQPDTDARRRLWEAHLRGRAPLAPDVDPARLAETFAVSGAHIRNAVVAAAFRAADEGGPLAMAHLGAAMRREYEKLGKAFPALSGADGGR